jgi:hypothetical protein
MNFLYSKLRNRLSLALTDKLLFIYINSRSLRKASGTQEAYKKKVSKEQETELLLNWEDDMMETPVDNDDDNDLAYAFNIDNFICDPLLENMDRESVDPVDQAAADAAWESYYTELFGTGLA